MPQAFEQCVESGGKVRTVSGPNKGHGLGKNQYVKCCVLNGKSHRGHVKTKKWDQNLGK